ncbi:uncharacterized protein G2W53_028121 [Senna tora]|uniref:Uncharacterized protein n=1 Tax=Senna tora TaxID=362788 RepID=A0A834T304_9FABA|nr:uncharacterized protein G2W53_028121 [Senna tora]
MAEFGGHFDEEYEARLDAWIFVGTRGSGNKKKNPRKSRRLFDDFKDLNGEMLIMG